MTGPENVATNALLPSLVGSWVLDTSTTTIRLATKAMWGMVKVNGHFAAVEGAGVVAPDGTLSGTLIVDAASVDTGQAKRDDHLRGPDFFEVERYPTFTYAATSARLESDGSITVDGTFSAHGQTHPLSLRGTVKAAGTGALTLAVETDLDRSQWGIDWTKMGARLDNHLSVEAVFTRS